MRVLWHSCAPWLGTGYGTQTALWTRYLRDAGHDVAVSAYHGNPGHKTVWEGIPVFPAPMEANVDALIRGHADRWNADVIVLLCDVWMLDPDGFAGGPPVLAWTPVDTKPLSLGDTRFHRQGPPNIRAVAMSEHGRAELVAAGVQDVAYIPHGIDVDLFRPEPEREQLRAAYGIGPATFAAGMAFNNIDPFRKAAAQQMAAFAAFHKAHRDSVLFVHSMTQIKGSLDLHTIAATLGIADAVRWADQYRMRAGDYSDAEMARWYAAMDVVLNATCGEGFGIPAVEAQACGTPVILADNTTGRQLRGPGGHLVDTVPFWNPTHGAWWAMPVVDKITHALSRVAASRSPETRRRCRRFAEAYDYRTIGPEWVKLIDGI